MNASKLLSAALLAALLAGCGEDKSAEPEANEAAMADTAAGTADDMATADGKAQNEPAPFKQYDAETFFSTTSYGSASSAGFAFSHDDSKVLMNSNESGVFNAYVMDVSSGDMAQLTNSDTNATFGVTFFPNDDRILYTFDEGGNELNHVYVRETDGSMQDLTPGEKVKASFMGWSDDNSKFYILSNERDSKMFDLYAYNTDGYERELLFENNGGWQVSDISPNGQYLAIVKNRTSADSDVYLKDLESDEEPQLITEHEGNVAHGSMTFTPDSNKLVIGTNEHGEFNQAWTYDIESGETEPFIQADWDVMYVGYSDSGKYRYSATNEDAVTALSLVDAETGESVALPELPEGEKLSLRFSRDESKLTLVVNGDRQPSDMFLVDLENDTAKRMTDALGGKIDQAHLVEGEVVRYESFDGLEIPSILYKPHQASADNPVPALVLVHGGPGGQTTKGYRAMVQHLVNHGYAILGANNRGSSGYGKTFYHMDDKRHGEEDLKDIVWGKKYLQTLDWVDDEKIGVMGGSYGGYMTAAALAFHPEEFNVGINIFGVTNWVRTLKSIPPYWESFREALYDEMGDPATDEERHRAISPLFHADKVTKPMLVVQGANDPRVLKVESDEIVAALQENEVPVEYVVFDDEGHGFLNTDNRIEAQEAYLSFLDRYLVGSY